MSQKLSQVLENTSTFLNELAALNITILKATLLFLAIYIIFNLFSKTIEKAQNPIIENTNGENENNKFNINQSHIMVNIKNKNQKIENELNNMKDMLKQIEKEKQELNVLYKTKILEEKIRNDS